MQEAIQHMNLPTISPEEEPYILTPEEERQALDYAVMIYAKKLKHPVLQDMIDRAREVYTIHSMREKLFYECNRNKHQQIWHEGQRKKRNEDESEYYRELIKRSDANYFFRLLKSNARQYGRELLNNENTSSYIKTICFFFSMDNRFETELKLDLKKGLWIRGLPGRGKTFLLECLQNNQLHPFNIHSMLQVAETVKETGTYEIFSYYKVIDDVDTEEKNINHFGTKINWFKQFLELYYSEHKPFNQLIVTTNSDFDMIEKSYGFRVRSRVKDMFNIIDVKGEDLRG